MGRADRTEKDLQVGETDVVVSASLGSLFSLKEVNS